MDKKFILSDVDGCALDWCSAFESHMDSLGYTKRDNADDHYFLFNRYHDLSPEEALCIADAFNSSDAIRNLSAYKDSAWGVETILEMGYDIIWVTAIGENPKTKEMRIENLNNVFGNGIFNEDNVVCTPLGISKYHTLKRWAGSGALWIEDHFSNAESGYELGLNPILVDTYYNRHYSTDLFPRTNFEDPWESIVEYLKIIDVK